MNPKDTGDVPYGLSDFKALVTIFNDIVVQFNAQLLVHIFILRNPSQASNTLSWPVIFCIERLEISI